MTKGVAELCSRMLSSKNPDVVVAGMQGLQRAKEYSADQRSRIEKLVAEGPLVVSAAGKALLAQLGQRVSFKMRPILIAEYSGNPVRWVDEIGRVTRSLPDVYGIWDAEALQNGNVLIADISASRVSEVGPQGKLVWQMEGLPALHDVDRLPNGNTLLAIRMLNEVREITPAGEVVMRLSNLSSPSDADRLPGGVTMVVENGAVRCYAADGFVLWERKVTWAVEANLIPVSAGK